MTAPFLSPWDRDSRSLPEKSFFTGWSVGLRIPGFLLPLFAKSKPPDFYDETSIPKPRLDLLRVLACYMVLQVHAGEFYYIADGGLVAAGGEPVWACWLNSLCRTAVPLFVMLSGFFLLPVRERTRDFFARRFVRVVVPFLVWCVLYAIYQFLTGRTDAAGALLGVCRIPVNFGVEIGHLWFVYMLLGLYLFAPVVSPWIETASRRAMEGYLALWAFTLCIPYVHLVFPELLGECFWNDTPMLYYFSGFLGYMVLAAYLRRYHAAPRAWHKWGVALLVVAGISRRHGFSTHGWRRSGSSRTSNFRGASGRSTWPRCRSGCSCC